MNLGIDHQIRRANFFRDYFEMDRIPSCYLESKQDDFRAERNRILIVNCIPPYLAHKARHIPLGYCTLQRSYRQGYMIDLEKFKDADEYLRNTLGKKAFKKIQRDQRRFNSTEGLEFNTYFGSIERKEYNSLMASLKNMIQERFGKQASKHTALQEWDHYLLNSYDLINSKLASLFCFQVKGKPVALGLNFHKDGVLASSITSFDSQYEKLSLGKLMLVRKLIWCQENGYSKMDLGWGDFQYKKKLSNEVYQYRTDVIFRKGNPLVAAIARLISYVLERKYLASKPKGF